MQGHVAAGGERAKRAVIEVAVERIHADIVAHEQAVEADLAADDVVDDAAFEKRARDLLERETRAL